MRKIALAVAFVFMSGAAYARDLSIEDILGEWCPDPRAFKYTFKRDKLIVDRFDNQSTKYGREMMIKRVTGTADQVDVYWEGSEDFTRFIFSDDKRELIQVAQTEGDKGPKRVFKRCKSRS